MLELRGIGYHPATAGVPVLQDVGLRLERGAPGLVAGRSGSGKSTLLDIIAGLARQDRGEILWQGQATTPRERRWLCGLVFQFPERHFLGLSVGQELRLGHRRLPTEQLQGALDRVGLGGLPLQQPPEQLSGGQQRRLALAVQLLRDPPVLLLDEPTAGLDWSVRRELIELLKTLAQDRLLLLVTHEPDCFDAMVSQRWRLQGGRCVRFDEPLPDHA
ncbi:MAG: ABC transporter ATP-binding protein [Cyanobacteriota bacterium]